MQVEYQDHGVLVPWTDPASSSYGDIPLDESAPDLLASDSPTQSPPHQRQQHHHHHHHSHHHHQTQQLHHSHIDQQRHHHQEQRLVTSPSVTYVTHTPYTAISEAEALASYEYANTVVPHLIPQHTSEMRTGPGGGGRVEGAGAGMRGWKRKGDDNEEARRQPKMDASHRCDVCGEQASGHYFGALVCLPCKSFFIRCTKDGKPNFSSQCGGKCDILKGGRVRCQHCRFQKCVNAGMFRKEKPEAVEPAEGQLLCKVCGDIANGVHFGVTTCEGCKKFFRRGLKENKTYTCKGNMHCSINPRMRNNCRYCRYQKCLMEGMSREAIKMGRPKKGDLSYRKPIKYNRMKMCGKGSYDKQMSESNRSSMSSEYEQDDMSAPEDVFDSVPSGQHQRSHPNHQLNNHIQQQQPQQQQPGTFSLGSILHECMTVQDWDQKVDIGAMDPNALQIVASNCTGHVVKSEEGKISPHVKHSSPALLPDMLNRQIQKQQEQQHLLQQHNHLQLQHVKVLDPVQNSIQPRHQGVIYQMHNPNISSIEVIADAFSNEHSLPVNRAIKVENVSLQDGPDSEYTEGIVLEDMRNLDSVNKSEFQTYQLQGLDPNPVYSVCHQQAGPSTASEGTTLVSISQLNPTFSSQIISINVSPQNVVYAPHNQHDPIIIHNLSNLQQTIDLTQNQDLVEDDMEHKTSQSGPNSDYGQEIRVNDMSSNRNHQIQISQGVIRNSHDLHGNIVLNPNVQNIYEIPRHFFSQANNNMHHQFSTEDTHVSSIDSTIPMASEPSLSPRRFHSMVGVTKFPASPTAQHTNTSSPSSFTTVSQHLNVQHKISGIRSPIAAILQQHREAIQAGRPIQLTPEEVEELLSTVNAEQQLAQHLIHEQAISKDQRSVSEQNNIDATREPASSFVMDTEQQSHLDRHNLYHRQTTSEPARNYPTISNSSQSMNHVYRKPYPSGTSPSSHSGLCHRQDLSGSYNSSNNSSQVSQYLSPQHVHSTTDNQSSQQNEVYDDSFNSSLIRDSTLLHEINRIFLGIDNSCDSYGCDHQDDDGDSRVDDEVIVSLMSSDEFSPEVSHKYWHGFKPAEPFVAMTTEQQKIIQDVLDAFDSLQKTYMTNEPEYINRSMSQDQFEHWHHIQRKIARHVVAGQRFCRNIPGYFKLDIQDRISLGKNVGFGLMVLIACTEFYDPEFKRFKHIWNWTMPMQNPLFSYKLHLLSLGDRMHDIQVDRTEASMMCAISMTSIDCPGLLKPKIVCDIRDALIDALQAHISTKAESTQRLKQLMSIMPQVRLMTLWYNNLMKKMSLPSDVVNSKMNASRLVEAVGSENTANFS